VSYAEGSFGSLSHLSMVALARAANLKMTNVSYRGNAPALADVIAGHLMIAFPAVADVQSFVKAGTLRPIAVASATRVTQLPDVPTFQESGYPGFTSESWQGLMAPAGTPQAIIDKIAAAAAKAGQDPEFRTRLVNFGGDPVVNTPAEFKSVIAKEGAAWSKIIAESGLKQP
jgi:tripartite-type tricarboxylate transporter receptor subunit TctC